MTVDVHGNVLVVWGTDEFQKGSIVANRYDVTLGNWTGAVAVEADDTGRASEPRIAVDALGNAVAVWQHDDGTRTSIWANRFVAGTQPGSGWQIAQPIETSNAAASNQRVAVDANGNATAVWTEYDGLHSKLVANRYVVGPVPGWRQAVTLESDDLAYADRPSIAMDASGNALLVWLGRDGARWDVWSNRFVVSHGQWEKPVRIELDDLASARRPNLAVDAGGRAVAVWEMHADSGTAGIWANEYLVGHGWGPAGPIEVVQADVGRPQTGLDASGNAMTVWYQSSASGYSVQASRYVTGTSGWSSPTQINTGGFLAINPALVLDLNGNATVTWAQLEAFGDPNVYYRLWSSRFQNSAAGSGF